MTIEISIARNTLIHREIPAEMIISDEMTYGAFFNDRFEEHQKSAEGFIAYNRKRIGRGIVVRHSADHSVYTLSVGIPASSEDIEELFLCSYGIMNLRSKVTVNHRAVSKLNMEDIKESVLEYNLKVLHEMMGKILNGESDYVSIGCARNRLSAGIREAEQMWAGINTDTYRDWMHSLQSSDADICETSLLEHKVTRDITLMYTVKKDRPFLLPKKPGLPFRFYDQKTGRPSCSVDRYLIRFTGRDENEIIGTADFRIFETLIPEEKKQYFDAENWYISGFRTDEIRMLVGKARELQHGEEHINRTSGPKAV